MVTVNILTWKHSLETSVGRYFLEHVGFYEIQFIFASGNDIASSISLSCKMAISLTFSVVACLRW